MLRDATLHYDVGTCHHILIGGSNPAIKSQDLNCLQPVLAVWWTGQVVWQEVIQSTGDLLLSQLGKQNTTKLVT